MWLDSHTTLRQLKVRREPQVPGKQGSQGWKPREGRRKGRGDNAFAFWGLTLYMDMEGRTRMVPSSLNILEYEPRGKDKEGEVIHEP